MRRRKPVPEPADEPLAADPFAELDEDADDGDDDGYFVLPVEVLERWRAATAARN